MELPKSLRCGVPLVVLGLAFVAVTAFIASTNLGVGGDIFDSTGDIVFTGVIALARARTTSSPPTTWTDQGL